MDKKSDPEKAKEIEEYYPPEPNGEGLDQLNNYNLAALVLNSSWHFYFFHVVPEDYPFYHQQFLFSIGFCTLAVAITFKITAKYLPVQSLISLLHLLWLLYCFSTVPVFLTAISSSVQGPCCNPCLNICFKAFGLLNDFQVKMFVGVSTQIFFAASIYCEMKRFCLLYEFPFDVLKQVIVQPNDVEKDGMDKASVKKFSDLDEIDVHIMSA